MNKKFCNKKTAVIISALLIIISAAALLYLLLPSSDGRNYTAEIYQDGELLFRIPLNEISETQTFTVENVDGGKNEIQIRDGGIGIISANCPDKLCVHQGFISDSKLPIVCLPNRLVIQLFPVKNSITPDIVTY